MEEKNSLIIIPKELTVLSNTLFNKDDVSVYGTLDQIYSIIDKNTYLEEYLLSSRSSEVEKEIKELEKESKLVTKELLDLLSDLKKGFSQEKALKENWSKLDEFLHLTYRGDAFFGLLLADQIKELVQFAIDSNYIDTNHKLIQDWFEIKTFGLEWKYSDIRSYIESLNRLKRSEGSKPWYHYIYLKSLSGLRSGTLKRRDFPVSAPELSSAYLDLMKTEEYPEFRFYKFSISEVKASWSIIYSYLEGSNSISKLDAIILFDSDTGVFQLTDGTRGKFSKKKHSYKMMTHFSQGNTSFDFSTVLSRDDCDTRNDITKYIRRKLKLTKDQLVSKDGFLSLVGVKVVSF